MVTPKLHTSLLLENLWKLIHSGAYHFSGHLPAVRACTTRHVWQRATCQATTVNMLHLKGKGLWGTLMMPGTAGFVHFLLLNVTPLHHKIKEVYRNYIWLHATFKNLSKKKKTGLSLTVNTICVYVYADMLNQIATTLQNRLKPLSCLDRHQAYIITLNTDLNY